MSIRASFVTEYIVCSECLKTLKAALLKSEKYLTGRIIDSWLYGEELPIIAGKLGASGGNMEAFDLVTDLREFNVRTCHPVRLVVIHDDPELVSLIMIDSAGAEVVGTLAKTSDIWNWNRL